MTLSHEMCHLACWIINKKHDEGHGALFKAWYTHLSGAAAIKMLISPRATRVESKRPDIHVSVRLSSPSKG